MPNVSNTAARPPMKIAKDLQCPPCEYCGKELGLNVHNQTGLNKVVRTNQE